MRGKLGNIARLNHILEAITEIESYLVNIDFDKFMENSMMRFACIKQIEIIGEASDHISENVKTQFSEIEWRQFKGIASLNK